MIAGLRILIIAFSVHFLFNSGDVNAQFSIEVNGAAGRSYYNVDSWSWYPFWSDDINPFLRNLHVTAFPFFKGIFSFGAEFGMNYFAISYYSFGFGEERTSGSHNYKAYNFSLPVRLNFKDGLFLELSPGIYRGKGIQYDWTKMGAVATAGLHLRPGKNLTFPIKIRAGIVLHEPVLYFLSGGIGVSYHFKAKE